MLKVTAQKKDNRFAPHIKTAAVNFTGTPGELDRLLGKLEMASIFDRTLKDDIDFKAITRARIELRLL